MSFAPVPPGQTDTLETDVLVVGGGISGLTVAWRLHQRGIPVLLTEATAHVGGAIRTQERDGWRWEEGPNSFAPTPALLNLIADLDLQGDLLLADGALPRYVYWQGQLQPVPLSPAQAVTSSLLTLGGKLRALRGVLGFVTPSQHVDETIEQFFSRHLGSQVFQRLVEPFVSGVYAGDPSQLSAAAAFRRIVTLETQYGGLLAGAWQAPRPPKISVSPKIQPSPQLGQLGNFRLGMQQLPHALANALGERLRTQWSATAISRNASGYTVTIETPTGPQIIQARRVVMAIPAYRAAQLLQPIDPGLSVPLEAIPYPPVAVVALGYPAEALPQPLQGFGHLVPRSQGLRTLGTIWLSCLFPGRAPQGYHCLLSFIGGATDPRYQPPLTALSAAQRAEIIHQDLSQILLTRSVEPLWLGEKLWTQAIPQYTLGHTQRWQQFQERLATWPGLFVCTNYGDGVSLGDCVQRGEKLAQELAVGA